MPTGRPALVSLSTARLTSGRDLVGVVEVEVDPQRVVLLEHRAELVVDALGQEHGHPRADPDDLDVGDLAEAAQDRFEELRGEGQPVPAADEHVPDLGRVAQVLELGLVVLAIEVLGRVADDPAAGAVAAVARALGRDEHEHAVRVAMDEAGHRGVAVLGQAVLHHRGERLLLPAERDDLAADRVVRIARVDEADEVRGDVDPELVRRREALALLVGQLEDLLDLGQVVDPVRELPAPVVPLLVGDVLPQRGAPAHRRATVGSERLGRVAPVDERRLGQRARGVLVGDGGADLLGIHAGSPPGGRGAVAPLTHKVYADWMPAMIARRSGPVQPRDRRRGAPAGPDGRLMAAQEDGQMQARPSSGRVGGPSGGRFDRAGSPGELARGTDPRRPHAPGASRSRPGIRPRDQRGLHLADLASGDSPSGNGPLARSVARPGSAIRR